MPLHNRLTIADGLSIIVSGLYYYQPFVDRRAVWQWVIDNIFGGSVQNAAGWGMFASHKATEWGGMAIGMLVPFLAIGFIEKHKVMPDLPWPWANKDPKVRQEFRAQCLKAFRFIVLFHLAVTVLNFLLAPFADPADADPDNIPEWWVSCYQCLIGTLIADIGFYFGHRLLHMKPFYARFHKQHHEFKDSCVLATFNVGVVDSLVTDIIPVGIAMTIFHMHMYTQIMFTVPLIISGMNVHCGYNFPLGFNPFLPVPFNTDGARPHDIHHRTGKDNYGGVFYLWDRIFGTYRDPDEFTPKWVSWKTKRESTNDPQKAVTQSDETAEEFLAETSASKKEK